MGTMIDVGAMMGPNRACPFTRPVEIHEPTIDWRLEEGQLVSNPITVVDVGMIPFDASLNDAYRSAAIRRLGGRAVMRTYLLHRPDQPTIVLGGYGMSPMTTIQCLLEGLGYRDVPLPQRVEDAVAVLEEIHRVKRVMTRYVHRIMVAMSLRRILPDEEDPGTPDEDRRDVQRIWLKLLSKQDLDEQVQILMSSIREPMDGWWNEPSTSAQGR